MKFSTTSRATLMAVLTVGAFASSPALAEHGGRGDHHRPQPQAHRVDHRPPPPAHRHIDHRPPPPRHAHRPPPPRHHADRYYGPPRIVHVDRRDSWRKGRRLPRSVIYHDVAPERISYYSLPVAPRGHRYVRVASDILLIAVGTGLVVDAIHDLSY